MSRPHPFEHALIAEARLLSIDLIPPQGAHVRALLLWDAAPDGRESDRFEAWSFIVDHHGRVLGRGVVTAGDVEPSRATWARVVRALGLFPPRGWTPSKPRVRQRAREMAENAAWKAYPTAGVEQARALLAAHLGAFPGTRSVFQGPKATKLDRG